MVVASLNTTTRRVSGTFPATGTPFAGTATITNGVFTNITLK